MKIVFTDHAKKRRTERRIPKKYILKTVKNPQKKVKSFQNRQLRQKQFGAKILEVVTVTEKDTVIVITEYFLEKEKL